MNCIADSLLNGADSLFHAPSCFSDSITDIWDGGTVERQSKIDTVMCVC